jgi:hypothetical protein
MSSFGLKGELDKKYDLNIYIAFNVIKDSM